MVYFCIEVIDSSAQVAPLQVSTYDSLLNSLKRIAHYDTRSRNGLFYHLAWEPRQSGRSNPFPLYHHIFSKNFEKYQQTGTWTIQYYTICPLYLLQIEVQLLLEYVVRVVIVCFINFQKLFTVGCLPQKWTPAREVVSQSPQRFLDLFQAISLLKKLVFLIRKRFRFRRLCPSHDLQTITLLSKLARVMHQWSNRT